MTGDAWLDAVRIARDFGDVRELLPPGIDSIRDAPYSLVEAIRLATLFLSFEELPAKEQPPRRIWLDGEALREWFDDVDRARQSEYGPKAIEDPVENLAAKDLISAY